MNMLFMVTSHLGQGETTKELREHNAVYLSLVYIDFLEVMKQSAVTQNQYKLLSKNHNNAFIYSFILISITIQE